MATNTSPRKGASAFQGAKVERRSWQGEFRASGEEGVIEGYVTKWGTVDSYGSTFERGCFAKTLQERGGRVKVLWNHDEDELIGKPLELREDDVGLFARIQLVMPVQRAREAFELAKAEALDSFSFGFRTIKDAWVDGVRRIKEVALYEVSPVVFEANSNALITGVRTMHNENEIRAEDFAATYNQVEMSRRHRVLMDALEWTLMDIFWGEDAYTAAIGPKMEAALSQFSAAYQQYVAEYIAQWTDTEERSRPEQNELARLMRDTLSTRKATPEQLAATTALTVAEVRTLMRGDTVPAEKLADLPDEIRKAASRRRVERLESLCTELRAGGLSDAERTRLMNLINPHSESRGAAVDVVGDVLAQLERFRASLNT